MSGTSTDPWSDMTWTAQPQNWSVRADGIAEATAKPRTDFWQRTFYGFERDDGHALLHQRSGDFSALLTVEAAYDTLYDQAGLMLRAGPTEWIKFGVELTDDSPHLSVVVTNSVSDWSARPIDLTGPLSLRATRLGQAVLLQHGSDKIGWQMARLAPVTAAEIGVGPYLCSPERMENDAPFTARFSDFQLSDPLVRDLHA